jgi:hypothetical protein
VFGGDAGRTFKAANIQRPVEVVALTEVNGTDDPKEIGGGLGNEKADAAWLDGYWAGGLEQEETETPVGAGQPSGLPSFVFC